MRRSGAARALLSAVLLTLPAILAGPIVGSAHAQPGEDPAPPDGAGVTLAWRALGVEPQMYLGPDSSTTVALPVPAGLTATRLQGVMHAPMNIDAGYLEINDGDGKLLATVGLPPAGAAQVQTPFDVDISAAGIRTSPMDLSLTLRAADNADRICGPLQQLTVSDMATVFTGTDSPATTIANFFPPVLERAMIYTPADPDIAEQQSVLTLVATLTRLYRPQPLDTSVVMQPRGGTPPPADQRSRAIVVESGGPAGIRVQNAGSPGAYLQISGSGDELSTQVSLLVNQLQSLAQTASARVDQAGSGPELTGDTLTFSQLEMSGKTDVLRTSNLRVGVDRSALGPGRVDSVKVHLLADYTPVPKDDAASVLVRSKGVVVYRAALDNTGALDATFDLPSQVFDQWVNLDFALTYTPHEACGPLTAPISFQIDPRSTLTMTRGGPPLAGFTAVPSEFSPSFMVALDGSGPSQLAYAARVVAAIASLTSRQLTPQSVDLETAADSTTGALIVANSAAIENSSLNPPVSGDGTAVNFGLPTELRADIEDGLGSIQAFADRPHNRSVVLVTTTDSWALVDPLLDYIDGLDGGWSQLTGDVLAAGRTGVPTNIAVRAEPDTFVPPSPQAVNRWLPIGVGAAAVVALVTVLAILGVRRRRSG